MAIRRNTPPPEPVGTTLLQQLAEIDERSLSVESARMLLELAFDPAQQERVHALSAKARQGNLTVAENEELDECLRVGDLLAILQSKARQVLTHAESRS